MVSTPYIAILVLMKSLITLLLLLPGFAVAQLTTFETSEGKQTSTYTQIIEYYKQLDIAHPTIKMEEAGPADAAYPLHVVYYADGGEHDIDAWHKENKTILLINNGIHPGEPDGIDACMMLLRDVAAGKVKVPSNMVLAVIPVFNIGGVLNRGSYSRANQLGPEEYGFRGNGQNLDLNRDFMKADARETQSLIRLFHKLDPDIFIDNHVSNGADYQHIVTLLTTQHSKIGGNLGTYLHDVLEPALYNEMKSRGYDLVPYVNHWGHTPEKGWQAFVEMPRFLSGFAALFQTPAFVTETHMLKPYKQRVEGTYALMLSFIKTAGERANEIKQVRSADKAAIQKQKEFAIEWKADTTRKDLITFKGFTSGYKPSEISGLPRLYYDRTKPYTKTIEFYNYLLPSNTVQAPRAYIISSAWYKVIERLKMNGVQMQTVQNDTMLTVSISYLDKYETSQRAYEGHYLHSKIKTTKKLQSVKLLIGDHIIPVNQPAKRYLIEALEAEAPDGFFAWGFFDAVLQQKEHFSDYVFEDLAADLIKQQPTLKDSLKMKAQLDTAFAQDAAAQLEYIYQHSPYYEPVHLRYPVFRLE
jgi:hypothetical protein